MNDRAHAQKLLENDLRAALEEQQPTQQAGPGDPDPDPDRCAPPAPIALGA
jgi:hypothetical protein